jgi:hypothetical protein
MRIIDRCPNCFSSSSSDETNSDNVDNEDICRGGKARKRDMKRKLLMPLTVLSIFGNFDTRLNDQRDYYSKFYTAPTIQPRWFCRGKKYEIERKHKVKKRDLFNGKLCNNNVNRDSKCFTSSSSSMTSGCDKISKWCKGKNVLRGEKYLKQ